MKILFVCLGNICRSPTAEAVFRAVAAREAPELTIEVDSAGTAAYHVGHSPDARSQEAARRRGYDLSPLRARQVELDDFEHFDLILAMDRENLSDLQARAPQKSHSKVRLFLEFAADADTTEVPDPYYGGANGFEKCWTSWRRLPSACFRSCESSRENKSTTTPYCTTATRSSRLSARPRSSTARTVNVPERAGVHGTAISGWLVPT